MFHSQRKRSEVGKDVKPGNLKMIDMVSYSVLASAAVSVFFSSL